MNTKKVLENYALIANLSDEEAIKQYPLSVLAISRIKSWCKDIIKPEDEDILSMLAASLVNLWVSSANASSSPTGGFSGNNYTITKDSSKEIDAAKELFNRWKSESADLLTDKEFTFISTNKCEEETL